MISALIWFFYILKMSGKDFSNKTASAIVGNNNKNPIDSFRALRVIKRPEGQKYSVMAYFICESHPDKPVAFVINLGNYNTSDAAAKRAKALIEETGHEAIFAGPTNQWLSLSEKNRIDRTEYLRSDKEEQDEAITNHKKELQRREEERAQIEKQILEEHANSEDPETLDHYIYNWYLLVRSRSEIEYHRSNLTAAEEEYNSRLLKIREQYHKQPEIGENWLPLLEERLAKRGESHIFQAIKNGYQQLRHEVIQ
jgi:hypothetical protein